MLISIEGLVKNFGAHKVLDGLDLSIEKGETLVVIGRSGCGKSVLLKHIIGIMKPDAGQILMGGEEITKLNESELNRVRKRFGMLFQSSALFDSMTVEENVCFALRRYTSFEEDEIKEIARQKLRLVGLKLEEIAGMYPAELSGGMKKRVALARAIAMEPKVVLYDEPTTGVDPIMADAINELIKDLHDRLLITSVVVTHDMKSAYRVADKIAMLYKGRIIEKGAPEEIQNSDDPVVRQFIKGLAKGPMTEEEL